MLAAMLVGSLGAWVWQGLFRPAARSSSPQWFTVKRGMTLSQVGGELHRLGLLRQSWSLPLLARWMRNSHRIQAGDYLFSPHQRPSEILQALVEGQVGRRSEVRVTFPEGWTLRQMAAAVERWGLGSARTFLSLAQEKASTFQVAGLPPGMTLEGYLFPDTYFFAPTPGERAIIERMLARFRQVMEPLRPDLEASGRSLHETVTLASLVEREAKVASERPIIAGVYINRLRRGMLLECDATIQYALGEHQRRLLYRHLEIDSPYNTYKYPGLPPGPIANPGRSSLEAAVHPTGSDLLYYVARPDGTHIFSRTYQEHLRAIRQVRGSPRPIRSHHSVGPSS